MQGAAPDKVPGGAGRRGLRLGRGVVGVLLVVFKGHGLLGLRLAGEEQLQAQPAALPACAAEPYVSAVLATLWPHPHCSWSQGCSLRITYCGNRPNVTAEPNPKYAMLTWPRR